MYFLYHIHFHLYYYHLVNRQIISFCIPLEKYEMDFFFIFCNIFLFCQNFPISTLPFHNTILTFFIFTKILQFVNHGHCQIQMILNARCIFSLISFLRTLVEHPILTKSHSIILYYIFFYDLLDCYF